MECNSFYTSLDLINNLLSWLPDICFEECIHGQFCHCVIIACTYTVSHGSNVTNFSNLVGAPSHMRYIIDSCHFVRYEFIFEVISTAFLTNMSILCYLQYSVQFLY
jgi:hypothetical protein